MSQEWQEKSVEEKIDQIIKQHLEDTAIDLKENLWETIENGGGHESPIEKIMYAALHFAQWDYWSTPARGNNVIFSGLPGGFDIAPVHFAETERDAEKIILENSYLCVYKQYPIGDYRADIALIAGLQHFGFIQKIAIECDGHDFHEKTKEQAARDKKRDRFFQSKGWVILRFTGSEIYNDPMKCAEEVSMCLEKIASQWMKKGRI